MEGPELPTTRLAVEPDWVDYNGHMNLAFYVLAFDRATDHFYDQLGIGIAYRERMQTLGMPTRSLAWRICRCKLDISTTSLSMMPMVPTPAAAR